MAWEELLKLHERQEDSLSPAEIGETREKGSLIQQAAAMIGQPVEETTEAAQGDAEAIQFEDGYVRRSPLQAYQTAEDFNRRRIRKAVTAVLGICLAALLIYALVKGGLLRLW